MRMIWAPSRLVRIWAWVVFHWTYRRTLMAKIDTLDLLVRLPPEARPPRPPTPILCGCGHESVHYVIRQDGSTLCGACHIRHVLNMEGQL